MNNLLRRVGGVRKSGILLLSGHRVIWFAITGAFVAALATVLCITYWMRPSQVRFRAVLGKFGSIDFKAGVHQAERGPAHENECAAQPPMSVGTSAEDDSISHFALCASDPGRFLIPGQLGSAPSNRQSHRITIALDPKDSDQSGRTLLAGDGSLLMIWLRLAGIR